MTVEKFFSQLERNGAPRCVLCGGKVMNGLNCTCAGQSMWLYRASQGKLNVSVCHVRDLSNDCVGGTRLRQMQAISVGDYGITKGAIYLPTTVDHVFSLIDTGRYGSHYNISYEPVVNTPHDAFGGRFRGNHDIFLSGPGKTPDTIRVGDPGSAAFHDWPKTLLRQAAGLLDLGGETLNEAEGRGMCYAYATPPDPVTSTWWPDYAGPPPASATFAVQFRPGSYPKFNSKGIKIGTFSTAKGFTEYGNTRFVHNGRMMGTLIEAHKGVIVDTTTAHAYYSKH